MKRELPYFEINHSFGGNQNWFFDPWMRIGGCGALTMCDLMIYMAAFHQKPECYPYDIANLSKKDYRRFGMLMKPYLRPRETGIKDLPTFIEGAEYFLQYSEIEGISFEAFDGHRPLDDAKAAVIRSIDAGLPVPMLMLNHTDPKFDFFEWHWFLIVGYEQTAGKLNIKTATYGKARWLDFDAFWETGHEERGGLVLVSCE